MTRVAVEDDRQGSAGIGHDVEHASRRCTLGRCQAIVAIAVPVTVEVAVAMVIEVRDK
jgi:hypothetical protein